MTKVTFVQEKKFVQKNKKTKVTWLVLKDLSLTLTIQDNFDVLSSKSAKLYTFFLVDLQS